MVHRSTSPRRLGAGSRHAATTIDLDRTNGPPVNVPERRSFGTRLIETLGQQLKGTVELAYAPTGFVYLLDIPLASLTAT